MTTRTTWDRIINSLLCVRLGQELGSSSDAAQAIAHTIDALILTLGRILG